MPRKIRPLLDRFWTYVVKTDGCWAWTGDTNGDGYGRLTVDQKHKVLAHRLSYSTHKGPIPDGLCVCHSCDNPLCCNPEHLFLGTRAVNLEDMTAKGRRVVGEAHGCSKLTEADVMLILKDPRKQKDIAKDFGVGQMTVSDIKRGVTWSHVHARV